MKFNYLVVIITFGIVSNMWAQESFSVKYTEKLFDRTQNSFIKAEVSFINNTVNEKQIYYKADFSDSAVLVNKSTLVLSTFKTRFYNKMKVYANYPDFFSPLIKSSNTTLLFNKEQTQRLIILHIDGHDYLLNDIPLTNPEHDFDNKEKRELYYKRQIRIEDIMNLLKEPLSEKTEEGLIENSIKNNP